ncbi:MAG TPA: bifunctional serine/threonine-protein kinase/universal stress protein [Burkholderiaceae bacterium]|nr:bifunctional serine/threonine-protein kinase/universal stress protein [Burkholderiaceae bacterium]
MESSEASLPAPVTGLGASEVHGPLHAGQLIDGFVLEERLHQGGMANLWRVRRETGDDPLPLIMKVPRIKGGDDPATIVGFEVEQMIMPTLQGPHVPRFIAKGDFTGQPYIVMELIPGESLRPRLDKAPLPFDEVADIGARVAVALHDLHRQHVVHLDVKPSNILFRTSGDAVLVDFGLSRHDHLPDLLDEEFRLPIGTGPYISPEQVQFVRNDPRSDLFALGVILYHLTTGHRPFGQPATVRGLRRRLYREPMPLRALRPDCPPWLQEVVLHCLEVSPERRYQSPAQVALDLQNPEQVSLTARSERIARAGWFRALARWFRSIGTEPAPQLGAALQVERNPILVAAIDIEGSTPALLDALRTTVLRLLQTEPGARLACVSVMKTARIGMDELVDSQGRSVHLKQLVALKHWARSIAQSAKLDESRLTFHVLEASDPAAALIEFAQRNEVDHVVMGARASSVLRRYLGSVSSQVVAQCPCTVTVVRV